MTANHNAPKPDGRMELYTHEPMVNWLGPMQLMKTGIRAAVATAIGAFVDPRAVQAALNPQASNPPILVEGNGDVWVDYLADTGDGWNSTYSVAWCISREIKLDDRMLPRGQVLLLGGDQVYPTPASGSYRTRFMDPFRSAFPAPVPKSHTGSDDMPVPIPGAPLMVATPGNHDWYDGLRGFMQLFCNQKAIGGWRTRQCTSYFVLQLPHGWWVWGLDLQLESTMDWSQREYFQAMANRLQPQDRVILCTPEPSWVNEAERVDRQAKRSLATIETQTPRFRSLKEIEELLGDRLALVLAGDSHHYARYAPRDGTSAAPHRITCGGGGAFLHGTHQLPNPPRPFTVGGVKQQYDLKCTYPSMAASRQLRSRAWRLPTHNLSFCTLLAGLYLMFLWMLQSASKVPHEALRNLSLMESVADLALSWSNVSVALLQLFVVIAHSPSSVIFAATIVFGAATFSSAGVMRAKGAAFFVGMLHGLLHLTLAVALMWSMGRINLVKLPDLFPGLALTVDDPLQVMLFLSETVLLGGALGGLLFGTWMVLTNKVAGLHAEEVFSSQRIADFKCFLRMRFDADCLTIYPMKIDKVCRRWKVSDSVKTLQRAGRSWRLLALPTSTGSRFVPVSGELRPELIEQPIEIHKVRS